MGNKKVIRGAKEIEVKNLLDKGVKQKDIEKLTGVGQASISRYVQTLQKDDEILKKFEEVKSKGLANLQLKGQTIRQMIFDDILQNSVEVIGDMSTNEKKGMLHTLTVCGAIDTDKQRLLEDKSTVNISSKSLVNRVDSDVDKIMEELGLSKTG